MLGSVVLEVEASVMINIQAYRHLISLSRLTHEEWYICRVVRLFRVRYLNYMNEWIDRWMNVGNECRR